LVVLETLLDWQTRHTHVVTLATVPAHVSKEHDIDRVVSVSRHRSAMLVPAGSPHHLDELRDRPDLSLFGRRENDRHILRVQRLKYDSRMLPPFVAIGSLLACPPV